ncbi:porin [Burkholderia sp. 22PA0106]|uniref:porin n=1 Tax=Burkholderia sp. 22PA0106 TaxID=3237371 RepID=UPI0039C49C64
MKRIASAMALSCLSMTSHAQGSVTLFGMLDEGVNYVTNVRGGHQLALQDSIQFPSVIGLQGREDLGGGTSAIFRLVSQFSVSSGTMTTAGTLFNRTALVGLNNARYGNLSFGNQYSVMMDSLVFGGYDAAFSYGGLLNLRQGPFAKLGVPQNPTGSFEFDQLGSVGIPNSVKYTSPTFHGVSAAAQYSFGGTAGAFEANRAMSFALNARAGGFAAALTYLDRRYPSMNNGLDGIRNYGAGLKYTLGDTTASVLLTDTQNTLTGANIWVVQAGAQRWFGPEWLAGINYQYMKGNAQLTHNFAHQVTAGAQYWLSKRTDVYIDLVFQQAGGDAGADAWINGLSQSSSSRQTALRIGLATTF